MPMFTFKVTPDDGETFEVGTTSRDIVKWESMGKGRSVGSLIESMRMTDITDLAYLSSDRAGLFAGDIRDFRAHADIEILKDDEGDEGDDESGPTRSAR